MKILLTTTIMAISLSSNAFFNNNAGWDSSNGYKEDNGIIAYNPYEFFDPRWAFKEALNAMDEIDNQFNDDNFVYNRDYASLNNPKDFPVQIQGSTSK
jgi:predicted secreted hydrolase